MHASPANHTYILNFLYILFLSLHGFIWIFFFFWFYWNQLSSYLSKKILVTNSLHFHSSEICLYFSSSVNIIIIIIIKGVLDTSPIYGTGGGSLTATNNSWTPMGCPTVQFNSDTTYQEIVSDPIY